MKKTQTVENTSQAISVLVQCAQMAQKAGILSLDDAFMVKSSIDFITELSAQNIGQKESESVSVNDK